MKISVITINYNNCKGLENSLESFFSQKNHNSEIIVVDGYSSDCSIHVIGKYKSLINKLVIERDSGIFNAMNKGLSLADGDFIYFLNSGDVFFSDMTLSQITSNLKDLSKIYIFEMDLYFSGKSLKGVLDTNSWLIHQACFVPSWIMKKFKFDENYKIYGDLDLWTRLKSNNLFNIVRISEKICTMALDGIGSSPFEPLKKIKDKIYFCRKHQKRIHGLFSIFNILFAYLLAISFGAKFVFFKYYPFVNRLKNEV